jgi:hypothetical protein
VSAGVTVGTDLYGEKYVIITKIVATAATAVAAGALCLPAAAPAAATSGTVNQPVSNVSYSVPTTWSDFSALDKKRKHRHHGNSGNVIQAPIQACGNNIGSNIIIGIGSKNQSVKSKNSGNCSQKTSSH